MPRRFNMMLRRQKSESAILQAMFPPIVVEKPEVWRHGVIFASPHSGNIYPRAFVKASRLSLSVLRKNEDMFIDNLFAPATTHGAPLIRARFPRCFVDVNRAATEMPSDWLPADTPASPRAEIGLGVVPTVIAQGQDIYIAPPTPALAVQRLETLYTPYHAALRGLISEAQSQSGNALLIDCHSMPGFSLSGQRRPDIILGDRYGISCQPDTITRIEDSFKSRGYSVARNHPYAGGYVTAHYGEPHKGVEVLQIEINKELYLNSAKLKPNKTYNKLAGDLDEVISDIIRGAAPEVAIAAQ